MQLGIALSFKDLCVRSENQLREALLQPDNKFILEDFSQENEKAGDECDLTYDILSENVDLHSTSLEVKY